MSSRGTSSRAPSTPSITSSAKHSAGSAASARLRSGAIAGWSRKCWRRSSALGDSAAMIIPRDSWILPTPAIAVHTSRPVRWLLRRNSSRSGRQNSSRSPVNTGPLPTDFTGALGYGLGRLTRLGSGGGGLVVVRDVRGALAGASGGGRVIVAARGAAGSATGVTVSPVGARFGGAGSGGGSVVYVRGAVT